MMYILVDKSKVKDKAFHETMPDGRVILPATALKMQGRMDGVTLVSSGTELKALINEQKMKGATPPAMGGVPEETPEEDVRADVEPMEEEEAS